MSDKEYEITSACQLGRNHKMLQSFFEIWSTTSPPTTGRLWFSDREAVNRFRLIADKLFHENGFVWRGSDSTYRHYDGSFMELASRQDAWDAAHKGVELKRPRPEMEFEPSDFLPRDQAKLLNEFFETRKDASPPTCVHLALLSKLHADFFIKRYRACFSARGFRLCWHAGCFEFRHHDGSYVLIKDMESYSKIRIEEQKENEDEQQQRRNQEPRR